MFRGNVHRLAIAMTGAAVVLLGSVLPAQGAATPGWRVAATITVRGASTLMTSVSATAANDAWAAGVVTPAGSTPSTAIERWNGKSWRPAKPPASVMRTWTARAGSAFAVIAASSATDVWAFSSMTGSLGERFLRLDGRRWSTGVIPGTGTGSGRFLTVTAVQVLGPANVWVFGGLSTATQELVPFADHFTGHWQFRQLTGIGEVTGASVVSARDIWAVTGLIGTALGIGVAATSSVLRWNGSAWKAVAVRHLPAHADLTGIVASAHNRVMIGGSESAGKLSLRLFAQQFTGTAWRSPVSLRGWTASPLGPSDVPVVESLVPDGHGGLWALGGNLGLAAPRIWHFGLGRWSGVSSPTFGRQARALTHLAAVPGTASVWAVGTVGLPARASGLIAIDGRYPR